MNIAPQNPIADLRKATGYGTEQLSLISGLTPLEIMKLESGELVDPAKIARLFCGGGDEAGVGQEVSRFLVDDPRNPLEGGTGGFHLANEQPNNYIYNYYIYDIIGFFIARLFVFRPPNNRFLVNEKPPFY